MKKIIVACGSGVATSQTVASKVQRLIDARNLDAQVEAVDIKSIKMYIKNADAYISITPVDMEVNIPILNGIAFLTGIQEDVELQKLIDIINS